MSLVSRFDYGVPDETVRAARAIFPKGNLYLQWYDTFGMLFADEDFQALSPRDGQPALSPVEANPDQVRVWFDRETERIVFVRRNLA
jgi:hypothetical protein